MLTNLEADRLNWSETDKIDRVRRAHAQRHIVGVQNSATRSAVKKVKGTGAKTGLTCRYFQQGTCKFTSLHRTAGQYYRHVCEHCDGLHVIKNCTQKSISKKLSSNAVAGSGSSVNKFNARIVYNSKFVNTALFDRLHIQILKSLCNNVKKNVLFSDIV